MTEYEKQTTVTHDEGLRSDGAEVQQRKEHVRTEIQASGRTVATNVVRFILGVILVLLGLRFIMKLLGANPASGFVDFIYAVSGVLTAPFDNVFGVASSDAGSVQSVFEPSILVAAIVYSLIAWGIIKLLNLNRPRTDTVS